MPTLTFRKVIKLGERTMIITLPAHRLIITKSTPGMGDRQPLFDRRTP